AAVVRRGASVRRKRSCPWRGGRSFLAVGRWLEKRNRTYRSYGTYRSYLLRRALLVPHAVAREHRLHVQRFDEERGDVGGLFDALGGRLAGAVTRPGFDADEGGVVATLGILKRGGELE